MLHKKRQAEPGADGGGEGFPDPTSDLSREAAHNLVMIYKASGSILMARRIMEEYLCV